MQQVFTLPGTLTISNVQQVKNDLLKFLDSEVLNSEFIVDSVALEIVDATGLQLLIVASRSFEKKGCSFQLKNISPVLQQLLELSGAADLIEIAE